MTRKQRLGSGLASDPVRNASSTLSRCRIAIYCQDGLGLGHLRRNIVIGQSILKKAKESNILLFTDSPAGPFFTLPDGMDHMKLPSIQKISAGHWQPTRLRIDTLDLQRMRRNLLLDAFVNYHPDLVLVDHMPGGAQGELMPALEALKRTHPGCSVVLGLRDILDDPDVIRSVWQHDGFYVALRRYYDRVLIYGSPNIFDTSETYNLPLPPHGIHYCGYVASSEPVQPVESIRQSLSTKDRRLVFVSAGGGADGDLLMRTYLHSIRLLGVRANFVTLMAPGIHAPSAVWRELRALARGLPVRIVPYLADSMSVLSAADLVVCMAGYNTLSEVLKLKKKALVVPRIGPSAEQRMRCKLFASRGLIDVLDPQELSPEALAERLMADLERDDYPLPDAAIEMQGAAHAADRLLELVPQAEYAAVV